MSEHISYIDEHLSIILAAGGLVADDGFTYIGAVYLLEVEDYFMAQNFIDNEPFLLGGLIVDTIILYWRKSYYNYARVDASRNLIDHSG